VVSLLQGKLLSGPVGSRFVVGPFVKPYPIPLALVLIKQTSFESLSEVGFSDLFLLIALPDVNPFCHAPPTVTIIAPDGRSRARPKQKTARERRVGGQALARPWMGISEVQQQQRAFPSVSRQRDGGT
jgi:hypothetical protein